MIKYIPRCQCYQCSQYQRVCHRQYLSHEEMKKSPKNIEVKITNNYGVSVLRKRGER